MCIQLYQILDRKINKSCKVFVDKHIFISLTFMTAVPLHQYIGDFIYNLITFDSPKSEQLLSVSSIIVQQNRS